MPTRARGSRANARRQIRATERHHFSRLVSVLVEARDCAHENLSTENESGICDRPYVVYRQWIERHSRDPYLASIGFTSHIPSLTKKNYYSAYMFGMLLKPFTDKAHRKNPLCFDIRPWQIFRRYFFSQTIINVDLIRFSRMIGRDGPRYAPSTSLPDTTTTSFEVVVYLLYIGQIMFPKRPDAETTCRASRRITFPSFRINSRQINRFTSAVTAIIRAWDNFAHVCKIQSIEALIAPYITFNSSTYLYTTLRANEGFASPRQANSLLQNPPPTHSPQPGTPFASSATLDSTADQKLRMTTSCFLSDLTHYLLDDKLFAAKNFESGPMHVFLHPSAQFPTLPKRFDEIEPLVSEMKSLAADDCFEKAFGYIGCVLTDLTSLSPSGNEPAPYVRPAKRLRTNNSNVSQGSQDVDHLDTSPVPTEAQNCFVSERSDPDPNSVGENPESSEKSKPLEPVSSSDHNDCNEKLPPSECSLDTDFTVNENGEHEIDNSKANIIDKEIRKETNSCLSHSVSERDSVAHWEITEETNANQAPDQQGGHSTKASGIVSIDASPTGCLDQQQSVANSLMKDRQHSQNHQENRDGNQNQSRGRRYETKRLRNEDVAYTPLTFQNGEYPRKKNWGITNLTTEDDIGSENRNDTPSGDNKAKQGIRKPRRYLRLRGRVQSGNPCESNEQSRVINGCEFTDSYITGGRESPLVPGICGTETEGLAPKVQDRDVKTLNTENQRLQYLTEDERLNPELTRHDSKNSTLFLHDGDHEATIKEEEMHVMYSPQSQAQTWLNIRGQEALPNPNQCNQSLLKMKLEVRTGIPDDIPMISALPLCVMNGLGVFWGRSKELRHQSRWPTQMWPKSLIKEIDTFDGELMRIVEITHRNVYLDRSKVCPERGGVFALEDFEMGDVICEYFGTLVYECEHEFEGDSTAKTILRTGLLKKNLKVDEIRFESSGVALPRLNGKWEVGGGTEVERVYVVPAKTSIAAQIVNTLVSGNESEEQVLVKERGTNAALTWRRGGKGIEKKAHMCETSAVCITALRHIRTDEEICAAFETGLESTTKMVFRPISK